MGFHRGTIKAGSSQLSPTDQKRHTFFWKAKRLCIESQCHWSPPKSHLRQAPLAAIHCKPHLRSRLIPLHVPKSLVHRVHYYDSTIAVYLGDAHEEFRDHLVTVDSPLVQVVQDCFILALVKEVTATHGRMMEASDLFKVHLPVLPFRPIPIRFILYAKRNVDLVIDYFNNPLCHGTSAWFWQKGTSWEQQQATENDSKHTDTLKTTWTQSDTHVLHILEFLR